MSGSNLKKCTDCHLLSLKNALLYLDHNSSEGNTLFSKTSRILLAYTTKQSENKCFCFWFCFVLFCFVLFCFVLFCFVLFCFLFCFVLFCFFDIETRTDTSVATLKVSFTLCYLSDSHDELGFPHH